MNNIFITALHTHLLIPFGFVLKIEELKAQLSESELRRLELEAELNSTKDCSSVNTITHLE